MTDLLLSQTNSPATGHDWQPERAGAAVDDCSAECSDINLKNALDWLLGEERDNYMSDEDNLSRQRRSADLLLWIINLELRLHPYAELA